MMEVNHGGLSRTAIQHLDLTEVIGEMMSLLLKRDTIKKKKINHGTEEREGSTKMRTEGGGLTETRMVEEDSVTEIEMMVKGLVKEREDLMAKTREGDMEIQIHEVEDLTLQMRTNLGRRKMKEEAGRRETITEVGNRTETTMTGAGRIKMVAVVEDGKEEMEGVVEDGKTTVVVIAEASKLYSKF